MIVRCITHLYQNRENKRVSTLFFSLFFVCLGVVFTLWGCRSKSAKQSSVQDTLFAESMVTHAQGFTLQVDSSGTPVLTITHTTPHCRVMVGGDTLWQTDTLLILPRCPQRIVTLSTSYIGFLSILEKAHTIVGVSGADYVADSLVQQRIQAGLVKDIGMDVQIDYEKLLSLHPDLFLVYPSPQGQDTNHDPYQRIREAGVPVIQLGEYVESTPLGRAEWIKAIAYLIGELPQATAYYEHVTKVYDSLVTSAQAAEKHPSVLLNLPWKDTWFIPGNDSFLVHFLQDAGATVPCSESIEGVNSQPLSYETMLAYGAEADYWLHPGLMTSQEQLVQEDPAFAQFPALKNHRVFNNTRQLTSKGGNPFFEKGPAEPHLILQDLITILHSSQATIDTTFHYYVHLP